MSVNVIDTIKPKNYGTFPVVEAPDVKVTNDKRLDTALNEKANQTDLEALSTTVAGKASQTDLNSLSNRVNGKQNALTESQLSACNSGITSALVTQISANTTAIAGKASQADLDTTNAAIAAKANASDVETETASLQAQIDNIVTPVTQDAEVENARVGADGTSYTTLKQRLDTEIEDNHSLPPLLADPTSYDQESPQDKIFCSDREIANLYIKSVTAIARTNSHLWIYIIRKSDSKIVKIYDYDVVEGENLLDIDYYADVPVVIGFKGYLSLSFALATNSNALAMAGVIESSNASPNEGDTITMETTSETKFCISACWNYAKSYADVLGQAKQYVDTTLKDNHSKPLLLEISAYTSNAGDSLYCSDYPIKNCYIGYVEAYVRENSAFYVYVIGQNTGKVEKIVSFSALEGKNIIPVNYLVGSSPVVIGIKGSIKMRSLNAQGGGYIEYLADYAWAKSGIIEASNANPNVGDVVTMTVASPARYGFPICWHTYEVYADVLNQAKVYTDEQIASVGQGGSGSNINLNNGNLLKYVPTTGTVGFGGRWFEKDGYMSTNNDGAEFYFKVSGSQSVTVEIDQFTNQNVTPYMAISIDGGAFTRQQINNTTVTIPDTNEHIVRIVIDGMTELESGMNKWNGTLGVSLKSVTSTGTIEAIKPVNRIGMFFGDSVTEGINALGTGANANVNSATNSYTHFCCNALNAAPHFVGYGGTGLLSVHSFHKCLDAIDFYCEGVPVDDSIVPDFICINHGINDSVTTEVYIAEYNKVIKRLRIKYGSVPIFCVVAFTAAQKFSAAISAMCSEYSNTYFVSTAGWNGATTDGTHLSAAGAQHDGELLANAIINVIGKSAFIC